MGGASGSGLGSRHGAAHLAWDHHAAWPPLQEKVGPVDSADSWTVREVGRLGAVVVVVGDRGLRAQGVRGRI